MKECIKCGQQLDSEETSDIAEQADLLGLESLTERQQAYLENICYECQTKKGKIVPLTHMAAMMNDIANHVGNISQIESHYTIDGVVAKFKTRYDAHVYELNIRRVKK